jgi:hypothetical protein
MLAGGIAMGADVPDIAQNDAVRVPGVYPDGAARGQAGLTLTQVSHRTRIRETIIGGIERDDISASGADLYAPGHIRAVAHAVGVDGEPLVAEYDARHGTPQATTAAVVPGPSAPSAAGAIWSVTGVVETATNVIAHGAIACKFADCAHHDRSRSSVPVSAAGGC